MKERISNIEFFSLFILSFVSSTIGLSLFITIKMASIDSYIGILLGSFIGIIPFLIFLYIFNYQKDKMIYDKINHLFGKFIGTGINYIITIIFFVIASTILFNISNFVVSQYLVDTPLLYIIIILGIIVYFALNKGIEITSRVSVIFLVIFLSSFVFGVLTLRVHFIFDNLKPILEFGIKKPFIAGLINSLITTMPCFCLLIIPKDNIVDKQKTTKYLITSYIISSVVVFGIGFISNGVLGKYLVELYQYPGYICLKKVSLFDFIDRIENFLSLHWILSSFITITSCLYYVKMNIKKNSNSKIINIIICILMVVLSYKLFKNNTVFNNYIYYVYPYILLGLFIIFMIIALVILLKKLFKKA